MDAPYLITGDKDTVLTLTTPCADWVVGQTLGVYESDEEIGPTRAELEAREIEIVKRPDAPEFPDERTVIDPGDLLGEEGRREADGDLGDMPPSAYSAPKRPYGNAPKSAWVRYAVAVDAGLTEERAETWTKADLMSKYGSRLGEED
jgi:hypothetical protein